jgi:hypothetical protein
VGVGCIGIIEGKRRKRKPVLEEHCGKKMVMKGAIL